MVQQTKVCEELIIFKLDKYPLFNKPLYHHSKHWLKMQRWIHLVLLWMIDRYFSGIDQIWADHSQLCWMKDLMICWSCKRAWGTEWSQPRDKSQQSKLRFQSQSSARIFAIVTAKILPLLYKNEDLVLDLITRLVLFLVHISLVSLRDWECI